MNGVDERNNYNPFEKADLFLKIKNLGPKIILKNMYQIHQKCN